MLSSNLGDIGNYSLVGFLALLAFCVCCFCIDVVCFHGC